MRLACMRVLEASVCLCVLRARVYEWVQVLSFLNKTRPIARLTPKHQHMQAAGAVDRRLLGRDLCLDDGFGGSVPCT